MPQFEVGPTKSLHLRVELTGNGVATVWIKGTFPVSCRKGIIHEHRFEAEIDCTSRMKPADMEAVEWALRGREDHAEMLAFRLCRDLSYSKGFRCGCEKISPG